MTNEPFVKSRAVTKIIILGSVAIMNSLLKDQDSQGKTCKDLAKLLKHQLISECNVCNEVRLMFDQYIPNSLKFKTMKVKINYRYQPTTI